MIISNKVLVFDFLPFIQSFDSNTRLKDISDLILDWNKQACDEYCKSGHMPDFHYEPYSKKQSYAEQAQLFSLKELGLID